MLVPYPFFGLPTPAFPPTPFFLPPAPMPTPVFTPKAPSKRSPKTKKVRAATTPYSRLLPSSSPLPSSSTSPLPASGSGTDRIHHLSTFMPENEAKSIIRSNYDVHPTRPYMWGNVKADRVVPDDGDFDGDHSLSSQDRSKGQPATFIVERHGGIERAMSRLATSKKDRRNVTQELKDTTQSRPTLDQRQDFYCFMHGCGQCFKRADKLARHMVENKRHRGTKSYICPHAGCTKEYLQDSNLRVHMNLHIQAGHADLPFPYPWNSPYHGMGDLVCKTYVKPESIRNFGEYHWPEDEDVAL
ncbi:hypothetical protein M422DRAFT_55992 [Sphaerobolus stellatus SS14]|uniref:Unplaced genomic scaffold SPHSTscaffold_343, whole genome shotgun sequence n=1 Tax=Sphaerobolus stellatus (strain SS14) TaxID=990650 RepID=A0A0C9UJI0_SPHS4|nr:hypothetical protein M422DRAFT_55992 [Sphaerobolus stellatus SS14]